MGLNTTLYFHQICENRASNCSGIGWIVNTQFGFIFKLMVFLCSANILSENILQGMYAYVSVYVQACVAFSLPNEFMRGIQIGWEFPSEVRNWRVLWRRDWMLQNWFEFEERILFLFAEGMCAAGFTPISTYFWNEWRSMHAHMYTHTQFLSIMKAAASWNTKNS